MPVYSIGGRTCLHFAAEHGQSECLEMLIAHLRATMEQTQVRQVVNMKDSHGYTALDLAIMANRKACVKILSGFADEFEIDWEYTKDTQLAFEQFVYDYYKSQRRIADNFKDTLPGMHGNCCETCKDMYHIADEKKVNGAML